jgi:TonB family protein
MTLKRRGPSATEILSGVLPRRSEAPMASTVAPKRDHSFVQRIKEWLGKKFIATEPQGVILTHGAATKIGDKKLVGAKSLDVEVTEAKSVGVASTHLNLRSERKQASVPEAAAPVAFKTRAADSDQGDRLVNGLRSAFGNAERPLASRQSGEPRPELHASERAILPRWIFAAVLVGLLLLALEAARWIYISPVFDKFAPAANLREMVADLFKISNGAETTTGAAHRDNLKGGISNSPKVGRQKRRREITTPKSNSVPQDGLSMPVPAAGAAHFEVKDDQNRRRILPATGTAGRAPVEQALTEESSKAISGGQPNSDSPINGQEAKNVGNVVWQRAAEFPEKVILPRYPLAALQKNIQGRVVVNAVISRQGTLQHLHVAGPSSLLSSAVLEALKKWRYQPHYENGVPMEVDTQIIIDFEKQ